MGTGCFRYGWAIIGKLTDVAIRNWIKVGERFEGRGDGDGLASALP